MTHFDKLVDDMRQEIREEGFMSAIKLACRIIVRAKEKGISANINCEQVMVALLCSDIHVIEYASFMTVDYRRKDLYYFNPDKR